MGGVGSIKQDLNAQLSVNFVLWELGITEGSEQRDHCGRG